MKLSFKDFSVIASVVCIGILLVGGTYGYIMWSANRLVEVDAQQKASKWASYLATHINDIDAILEGQKPSSKTDNLLEIAQSVSHIFRIKLFDQNGTLQVVSDDKLDAKTRAALYKHNPKAAKVLKTGVAITNVKYGSSPNRPAVYAESYQPVIRGDKTIGVVEAYVDQSELNALINKKIFRVAMIVALMMAVFFCLPATAFYLRTREKQKADAELAFLAQHDGMTGLINRNVFLNGLSSLLDIAQTDASMVAVHYIDVDKFKEINDTLGHDIGDRVIAEVAERLRSVVGENDLVCRAGGDEFIIAQVGLRDEKEAEDLAEKLITKMREPFKAGYHDIAGAVSIGISISPQDGTKAAALMKRADLALYRVKANGRNGFKRFEAQMDIELETRRKLESIIRTATLDETFELNFQPLYHFESEELIAFEALLRLPGKNDQLISPAVFVPIAEDMGLINEIGAWVIQKALNVAAGWPEHIKVAINLSPLQFQDGKLINTVAEALFISGVDAQRLELEITEGLLLTKTNGVMDQLKQLQELGISIVMDDFGTGYSSLSYLWQFPFDKIKIDRSFLSEFEHDENAENILKTIVSLGHSLKMSVTAEGVETIDQANFLKGLSCDQLQGYYFGRPLPEVDLADTIMKDFTSNHVEELPSPDDVAKAS